MVLLCSVPCHSYVLGIPSKRGNIGDFRLVQFSGALLLTRKDGLTEVAA